MGVQFKFDPNQEYQVEAIEAVADLLEGQPRLGAAPRFIPGTLALAAVANELSLTDDHLLQNPRAVQQRRQIAPDAELKRLGEGRHLMHHVRRRCDGTGPTRARAARTGSVLCTGGRETTDPGIF